MKEHLGEIGVKENIREWASKIGLSGWIFNIHFSNKYNEEDKDCEVDIEVDQKYHEADITVYARFWEFGDEHQEINVIHELCHVFFWPLHAHLSPSGDDTLEEAVQSVAMALYGLEKTNGEKK